MKRINLLASAVLVGVFLLGGLAGGAGVYAYSLRQQVELIGPRHHERRMRALERRLNLTAEQRNAVRAVFDRHFERMEQLKRELFDGCGKPLREEMEAVDAEVRALLDETQQREFDALVQERERRGLHGPAGPPGRGHRGHRGGPPR